MISLPNSVILITPTPIVMKHFAAILLMGLAAFSCEDSLNEINVNKREDFREVSGNLKQEVLKGPKNKITIDFTSIADQHAIVTLTGTMGEGTYIFDSSNGELQYGVIPKAAHFNIKWEYFAVNPVSCNYMLYWNYTGISIYGTYTYSWIEAIDVALGNKASLTFYKDCA